MKPIYKTIKVTPKTQTQKLPVTDQLRLLLGKVTTDDTVKLEASEKLSRAALEVSSALSNLIDVATARMRELGETSVTISLSSRFKAYLDYVINDETGKGRFYDFEIIDRDVPLIGVDYYFIMRITEKEV